MLEHQFCVPKPFEIPLPQTAATYPNLGVSKAQPPLMTMAGGIAWEGRIAMRIEVDKWVIQ